ncbi:MAG: type I-G CRISPR-associated protein, Cas3-extension family [Acidobacteriota bacterium]
MRPEHRGVLMLEGLDGGNPLAFLAALGTLRAAAHAWPETMPRLSWRLHQGAWRPRMTDVPAERPDQFVQILSLWLAQGKENPSFHFSDNLVLSTEAFRDQAIKAQRCAAPDNRTFADFLAAFACEATTTKDSGKKVVVQDTALRTMSGAGHQHFIRFMQKLAEETSSEQIYSALFEPWQYRDGPPSMRWDPNDDRRYALRWANPSGDKIKTVRGANRLAIEALPLLPAMPVRRTLETTGFTGKNWTWPIWECPAKLEVVRSLLALPELQELQKRPTARTELCRRGIVEIYRSRRLTTGKYRNFTQGVPV